MKFRDHFEIKGKHALFSPSKSSWIRKSEEDIVAYIQNEQAKALGTRLHALAEEHIDLGIKMPKNSITLNNYINDCIGYKMKPEQPLKYSDYVFGTTDAISFRNERLRIHDLKTGKTPAHMEQLITYAALFCLEYGIKPSDIDLQLAIYQSNEIISVKPELDDVHFIMDKIKSVDRIATDIMEGE